MKTITIILLCMLSCNMKNENNQIKLFSDDDKKINIDKIYIYHIAGYVVNPNSQIQNLTSTVIENKMIYKVNEKYNGSKLISSDTVKAIKNNERIKNIVFNIPSKFLTKDQKFGVINAADEGSIGVTIFTKSKKQIFWELSYTENTLPSHIKPFYQIFKDINEKLMN